MANQILAQIAGFGDSYWVNTEVVASGSTGCDYPVQSKGIAQAIATAISSLPKGVVYKGAVEYYSGLPATPTIGDAYTVLYTGTEGTSPDGAEYVWAKVGEADPSWVMLAPDMSVYAKLTGIPVAANVATCAAEDVAGCVTSINAILTALKTAGLMEADE